MPKKSYRVAISSTLHDLSELRAAAFEACLRAGALPLTIENLTGNATAFEASLNMIDQADIYLGIVGFRYGLIPAGSDISVTEIEYQRASERQIPRMLFFMSDDYPIRAKDIETGTGAEKLAKFKSKILRERIVSYFRSPDELQDRVVESLLAFTSERSKPKRAVLLIPFLPQYNELRAELEMVLSDEGLEVARFDGIKPGARWANTIADAIRTSDLVIAFATESDATIMYQLGYAHALKKPTLLLADESEFSRLPADLMSQQVIFYNPTSNEKVPTQLIRMVRVFAGSGGL